MSQKIKYAVHPGTVRSKNDGQFHFITFAMLVRLYDVDPRDCVNWEHGNNSRGRNFNDYTHLYPRANGCYKLPGVDNGPT